MPELFKICLIVCPLVFLAGFIDSIAGGGGLISLPAYLISGLPPHLAAGTNKVVNGLGTLAAAGKFLKSGKMYPLLAAFAAAGALIGSFIGTRIALIIPEQTLKIIILCALPAVAAVMILRRGNNIPEGGMKSRGKLADRAVCLAIGLVMGCYDGLVGPGTGTFMIMGFSLFLGMDLLYSSGCAKVGNLASNAASAVIWLINGKVMLPLVLPTAACSVLGNYLGARFAVKKGAGYIRYVMLLVLALLFARLIYDIAV